MFKRNKCSKNKFSQLISTTLLQSNKLLKQISQPNKFIEQSTDWLTARNVSRLIERLALSCVVSISQANSNLLWQIYKSAGGDFGEFLDYRAMLWSATFTPIVSQMLACARIEIENQYRSHKLSIHRELDEKKLFYRLHKYRSKVSEVIVEIRFKIL